MIALYRTRFLGALAVTTAALLSLFTGGCGGDFHATAEVQLEPEPTGTLSFLANMRFSDGTSVGSAELLALTLGVESPDSVRDLSFLRSIEAQAVTPTTTTTVATLDTFPPGERSVPMHIDYFGDLQPLFENANTIRLAWTATLDPTFTWPDGGILVQLGVDIGRR